MSIHLYVRPKRKIDRIFIHCSASDVPEHDNIATIKKWHIARGFNDIGYHFFIHKNGKVSRGRDLEKTPASQKSHNVKTIAICLHGLHKDNFTQAQYDSLKSLCIEIDISHLSKVSFHGHCEVSEKACPVIDYKKILKLDRFGSLGLNTIKVLEDDVAFSISNVDSFPDLQKGSRGKAVVYLQELLFLNSDGIFGPVTAKEVRSFKKKHNYYPSDIVQKYIWKLLLETRHIEHYD